MTDSRLENSPNLNSVFYPMTNVIQNYAWGSTTSFNQLFDIDNAKSEPQAELWMGAHPNGCSMVEAEGVTTQLSQLINSNRDAFIGAHIANHFGELPYLFKVLAAEKALSIQVHPNKHQAETGYAREEQQGIPLSASERNYKDPNHKPELVYALTRYQAMNGFRSIPDIIANFTQLDIAEIKPLLNALIVSQNSNGLRHFFSGLLSLEGEAKEMSLSVLLAQANISTDPLMALILELEIQYPGDIGLFAPLLLNVITLEPGQAMFLDAETPHAYIKGTGLEIMANSDNVLRAGLTPKHMDIDELAACTIFEEKPFDTLLLEPNINSDMLEYPIPVEDFKFAIIPIANQRNVCVDSAEILLPLDEAMTLEHENGQSCVVDKGQSVFVPAFAQNYTLTCAGRVARAYC